MALIANYVLYWETFSRIWISFLFHVSTSSNEHRSQCITLESETEKFYVHTYLRTVITSEWKEMKKVFLFHQGHSKDFDGTGKVDKKRAQTFTRTPWWGLSGENLENCLSKCLQNWLYCLGYRLKDIRYSLNPKYWKIKA